MSFHVFCTTNIYKKNKFFSFFVVHSTEFVKHNLLPRIIYIILKMSADALEYILLNNFYSLFKHPAKIYLHLGIKFQIAD